MRRIRTKKSSNGESQKSQYEVTVDLIRSIIWPLFIGSLLIIYNKPFTETVSQLPNLLATSSELSIAGLKVQIDREISSKTTPEVLNGLSKLSPDGIERLMNMTRSTPVFKKNELKQYENEWKELLALKLVEIIPWYDKYDYGMRTTIIGRDTQQFVFLIISQITGRLNTRQLKK